MILNRTDEKLSGGRTPRKHGNKYKNCGSMRSVHSTWDPGGRRLDWIVHSLQLFLEVLA